MSAGAAVEASRLEAACDAASHSLSVSELQARESRYELVMLRAMLGTQENDAEITHRHECQLSTELWHLVRREEAFVSELASCDRELDRVSSEGVEPARAVAVARAQGKCLQHRIDELTAEYDGALLRSMPLAFVGEALRLSRNDRNSRGDPGTGRRRKSHGIMRST